MNRRIVLAHAGAVLAGVAGCTGTTEDQPQDTEAQPETRNARTAVDAGIVGRVQTVGRGVRLHSFGFAAPDPETYPTGTVTGTVENATDETQTIQISVNYLDDDRTVFDESTTLTTDIRSGQQAEFETNFEGNLDRLTAYELIAELY